MLTKYELNFITATNSDGEATIHSLENDFYSVEIAEDLTKDKMSVFVVPKVKYAPEIHVSTFKGELQIKIQTTAYGSLNLDEYNHFIECATAAKYTVMAIEEEIDELY